MLLQPDQLFDREPERLSEPLVGELAGLQLACVEKNDARRVRKRGCMTKGTFDTNRLGGEPRRISKGKG